MAFDPISAVAGLVDTVVNKIFPDKTEAAKAKAALDMTALVQEFQLVAGQQDINKAEAGHASIFVAGWRPFVGWVCGCGFAWQFVIGPFLKFILDALGKTVILPTVDIAVLMNLLLGMLGIAGMRTYEKLKNVENNR